MYAGHFPKIGMSAVKGPFFYHFLLGSDDCYILKEISKFHDSQILDSGYTSQDGSALTICNASPDCCICDLFPSKPSKLTSVDLMYNKLTEVPDVLSLHEESIANIGLSFNHYKCIPSPVFDFKHLIHLNIVQNQISFIPSDIEKLCNLKVLLLDNNRIRMLPDQLGKLKNLKILGLGWNILTSLPKTMKNLCSLRRLELHHNQFKVFPSVLCSSELQLDTLTMDNNRIQVVPESAKNLISSLTYFTIHCNPIQIKDSLTFFYTDESFIKIILSHGKNSKPRGTLRVLILGRSGSGKSSLAKAVVGNDYITPIDKEEIDHTVGIDQYSYRFGFEDKVYEISLWDFAGEKCYAMMNQMFISPGSLVWLVFNMHKYKIGDKECFENNIGIWLRGVRARMGNPVVWIIGTHEDECGSMAGKIKANVKKFLRDIFKDICVLVLSISNAHDLGGHDELKKKIKELPAHQAFSVSFEEFKPHWLNSEEYLLNLASQKMNKCEPPIISKAEAFECLKTQGLIEDEKDFNKFIKKLHKGGEIFIFKESVCLDVVWLISLLREIFRSDLADQLEIGLPKCETQLAIESIRTAGTISSTILLKIWKAIGVAQEIFNEIVALLFEFKLAFKVQSHSIEDSYMFPWLLSEEGHEKITFSNIIQKLSLHENSILMVHSFDFIPPSFFEQVIMTCSLIVDISNVTRHLMSADFNHLSISILRLPEDTDPHKGYIAFSVCDNRFKPSYSGMWSMILGLNELLQKCVKDWRGIEQPRSYVVCPQCVRFEDSSATPYLFPFKKLEGKKLFPCQRCKDAKNRKYKIPVRKLYPPQAVDGSAGECIAPLKLHMSSLPPLSFLILPFIVEYFWSIVFPLLHHFEAIHV